jgi:hypothetical protein
MPTELTGRTRWFPRKRWFRSPKNVFQVEVKRTWLAGDCDPHTFTEYEWIDADPNNLPRVRVSDVGVLSVDSNELARSDVFLKQIEALARMENKESE